MSKNTSFFGFFLEKPKNDVFFDITKPPLAQIYPKSGL